MEIDNEREGEVEWATYKLKQRHRAGANRKRVWEREEGREWWRDEGGSERGRRQMWGQVLLSAQKTHVNLLLTGGTNYWQQEGKEVFHCHTRKHKQPYAETYYCFFIVKHLMCPSVGRMTCQLVFVNKDGAAGDPRLKPRALRAKRSLARITNCWKSVRRQVMG